MNTDKTTLHGNIYWPRGVRGLVFVNAKTTETQDIEILFKTHFIVSHSALSSP